MHKANKDTLVGKIYLSRTEKDSEYDPRYQTFCKNDCGKILSTGDVAIEDDYLGVYCSENCRRTHMVTLATEARADSKDLE